MPRACLQLGLDCDLSEYLDRVVATREQLLSLQVIQLSMFPNPASGQVTLQVQGNSPMTGVQVFDLSGRIVQKRL